MHCMHRDQSEGGKINLFECLLIKSILIAKNEVYFRGPLSMFAVLTCKVQRSVTLVIAVPCDLRYFRPQIGLLTFVFLNTWREQEF